jgi:hypothetical protein
MVFEEQQFKDLKMIKKVMQNTAFNTVDSKLIEIVGIVWNCLLKIVPSITFTSLQPTPMPLPTLNPFLYGFQDRQSMTVLFLVFDEL